jgi:pyruvate dehydrogenase E2 component (dihydrolipoamide acetyltransferase)
MPREFRLPDVGEGVAEGELLQWLVEVGDTVEEDQPVAEVETDKAVVEVPSPVNGSIQELHAEPGDVVPVGDILVTFAVEGEAAEPEDAEKETTGEETESAPVSDDDTGNGAPDGRVFAPPHVKRLARELGVDIQSVDGNGPGGRVTEQDVRATADSGGEAGDTGSTPDSTAADSEKRATADSSRAAMEASEEATTATSETPTTQTATAVAENRETASAERDRTLAAPATRNLAAESGVDLDAVPASEQRDGEAFVTPEDVREYADAQQRVQAADAEAIASAETAGETAAAGDRVEGDRVEREPYRGVRKTIGDAMARSKFTAPHATHHDRVDATGLVETREKLKPLAEERGVRLTYLPIVMKAVVGALAEHPVLNTMLDEENEEIVYNDDYNVGVAVATDAGLMVPVVKNVDEKGLLEIADEVTDLVARARDRSITREEMQGGTFTITNFGTIGGEYATPIINYPETAILGLGALEQRPMVEGGSLSDPGEVVAKPVLPLSLSIDHRVIDGADAARFVNTLKKYLQDPTLLLLD